MIAAGDDVRLSALRHLLAHQGAQRVGVGDGVESSFFHAVMIGIWTILPSELVSHDKRCQSTPAHDQPNGIRPSAHNAFCRHIATNRQRVSALRKHLTFRKHRRRHRWGTHHQCQHFARRRIREGPPTQRKRLKCRFRRTAVAAFRCARPHGSWYVTEAWRHRQL